MKITINFRIILLFLILNTCLLTFVFAETIKLKSGKIVEGKILERTDKYIKIDFYGVPLTYFFDEIETVNGKAQDFFSTKGGASPKEAAFSYLVKGTEYASEGQFKEAETEYNKGLKIDKNNYSLRINLGIINDLNKQIINEQYARYLFKGLKLIKDKQYQQAITEINKALQIKPDYDKAHCALGAVYANMGQSQEAVPYYEKALRLNPDDVSINSFLGLAYTESMRYQEAIVCFKKVIELNPNDVGAYVNLNALYNGLNQLQIGLTYGEKAIKLDPNDGEACINLGSTYFKLGQYQQALSYEQKAVQLMPNSPGAHFNLAVCYYKLDMHEKARENLQKAKELSQKAGDYQSVQQIEEILSRIP